MTQTTLIFDGATFDLSRDGDRLTSQLERVRTLLSDGAWHTLTEMVDRCGGNAASISARLRDLRKVRFGGMNVERRYVGEGVWEYRVTK